MVPGEGPQPCLAMIVGEAPGRNEVEAGSPFVGQSGKLLETILRSFGLARSDIYITNVVKDLPLDLSGKIRRPSPEEVEEWRHVFEMEMSNTAPAAVLALGRTAADFLTGLKGVPFGSKIDNIFTAWHPAYVLRSGYSVSVDWLEQVVPWADAVVAARRG